MSRRRGPGNESRHHEGIAARRAHVTASGRSLPFGFFCRENLPMSR